MFDSYHIKTGPSYPQHVHHHQPTTPEQLSNLRETEEKIRSQIVSTHNFNNELNGRVTTFYDRYLEQHTILISFRINGSEKEIRKTVCDRDFMISAAEAFRMLAESIAIEITKIMLEPMDREINNRRDSIGI